MNTANTDRLPVRYPCDLGFDDMFAPARTTTKRVIRELSDPSREFADVQDSDEATDAEVSK